MILPALAPVLALLVQAQPVAPPASATTAPVPPAATAPVAGKARHHVKGDPLERYNRYFFRRYQGFDRHFLRPVALGYKHVVPKALRSGLRNFFSNLGEPLVFLNYVLQLKPGKAVETATRFALNSSLGIGGTIDIAKSPGIRLPHRPNGFGDTLGYYGVGPGPYLFLPLLGPTTVRDLIGGQAEAVILPFAVGTPFDRAEYQVTRAVVTGLDARAEADSDLNAILGDAVDPYATFRSVYLQDRAGEIAQLHGPGHAGAKADDLRDPLADPAAIPPAPADPATVPPASTARELQDPLADPAAPSPTPATPN